MTASIIDPAGTIREPIIKTRSATAYKAAAVTTNTPTAASPRQLRNTATAKPQVRSSVTPCAQRGISCRLLPDRIPSRICACTSTPGVGNSGCSGVFKRSPISVVPKPTSAGRPRNRSESSPCITVQAGIVSKPSLRNGIGTRTGFAVRTGRVSSCAARPYEERKLAVRFASTLRATSTANAQRAPSRLSSRGG